MGKGVQISPNFRTISVYNSFTAVVFCFFNERQITIMSTPNHFKLEPDYLETIKALAEEINRPVEEVGKVYASKIEKLKSSARLHDYLLVLASKKVRDELRR